MISENEKVAKIKFDKYDTYFINDIEKQLKIDLCDKSNFTALSNINGINVEFPAFALKQCDYYASIHGVVNIQINSNNEALIDNELVSSGSDIKNKVLEVTNEWMKNESKNRLAYLITWDSLTRPSYIKNRINETLFAVKIYSDSISILNFKKKVSELNSSEVKELKNKFDFKIGFGGYKTPIPPPPPPKSNETE